MNEFFAGRTSTLDILIHGGNSVGMMVDLLIASYPMHIFHFFYGIAFGTIYLAFSIIYYFAGGTDFWGNKYIYHVLNWENPGSAASVAAGTLVLIIFMQIIACIIQKVRYRLYKKYFKLPELPIINETVQRF